jgi:hypothetical protein
LKLFLEMFICGHASEEEVCHYRLQNDITDSQKDPDILIKDMLVLNGIREGKELPCAHSTSWRYEVGRIILTYLVWTSGEALGNLPCRLLDVNAIKCPVGAGPLAPRPEYISEDHVLTHGLRHLSYLVFEKEDPFLVQAIERTQAMGLMEGLEPALAGRI